MTKIMLVEDDATMLALLATLLEMEGFTVARIRNEETIEELVHSLRREKPDVALLDIHLRQISGFTLLQQLKANEDTKSLRVIMSSGLDRSTECLDAGADAFILKPYMPDDLVRAIRRLIAKPGATAH